MLEIRVAAVQMDVLIGALDENRERILRLAREAAGQGAELVVFPECALSGYVFDDLSSAHRAAEPVPGFSTEAFAALCRDLRIHVVVGMLERVDGRIFNSAVLCGPGGVVGCYRKTHLPFLGVDRFTTPGEGPYRVFDTPIGRIGMLICYDLRFPEAARCLTLEGADLVALPTNWPEGAEASPDYTAPARAIENRIYLAAVNRAGCEGGVSFIGKSQIVDPSGRRLALAETAGEAIVMADCNFAQARRKRVIIKPGVFEIDTVNDRRPELYGALVREKASPAGTAR